MQKKEFIAEPPSTAEKIKYRILGNMKGNSQSTELEKLASKDRAFAVKHFKEVLKRYGISEEEARKRSRLLRVAKMLHGMPTGITGKLIDEDGDEHEVKAAFFIETIDSCPQVKKFTSFTIDGIGHRDKDMDPGGGELCRQWADIALAIDRLEARPYDAAIHQEKQYQQEEVQRGERDHEALGKALDRLL